MFQESWAAWRACLRAPIWDSTSDYCVPSLMLVLGAWIALEGIGLKQPRIAIVLLVVIVLRGPRCTRSPRPCDSP